MLALLGVISLAGYVLRDPVSQWLQKSPQVVQQLEHKLRPIKETVQEVDKAAAQVEKITNVERARAPRVEERQANLCAALWDHTEQLLSGTVMTFFLLYFLLATGERLRARIAALAPTAAGSERILDITTGVERTVSGYLATITLTNIGLGACTALLMYGSGMPNPLLWGVLAMLLNFIPYRGAMVTLAVLAVVALPTFDALSYAVLVPGGFLLLTTLEGQVITPLLLGRRLALNPVIIFVGLIFWAWLGDPAGALLAVSLPVTLKILCDHVPPLAGWPRFSSADAE